MALPSLAAFPWRTNPLISDTLALLSEYLPSPSPLLGAIGFWAGRLRVLDGPGEATIRGSLAALKTLAERRQDPDQLFFQRRLVIEGDTELGLGLKNLLDSLEWDLKLPKLLLF